MPRSEDVLSIFLASPSDVTAERTRLVEVISDWNRAWSRNIGLRLELLRWEEDAYPDIGDDAQAVINRQIPNDWDMFVGIMWSRFGTPTDRSGSGTQEEFENAVERHRAAPSTVSVLFYFKDAPIAPSKVDIDQLSKVHNFKRSTQSRGLLTWNFVDTDEFEKLANLHITKHVQAWRKKKEAPDELVLELAVASVTAGRATVVTPDDSQDDSGYLDLLDEFTERSAEIGEIATRITTAQRLLTEHNVKGREELDALMASPSDLTVKKFRSSIGRVANEMLQYIKSVEVEIPLFRAAVDASISALTRSATLIAELYPEEIASTKSTAIGLLATLIAARQSTEGFKDATASLPRMTKELNVAKRKQVAMLASLVAEFENGERLLTECLSVIDGLAVKSRRSDA